MTPEQFCYWLQGFCELSEAAPTEEQWDMVKEHLNLVFDKVTLAKINKIEIKLPEQTTEDLDAIRDYIGGSKWSKDWPSEPTKIIC